MRPPNSFGRGGQGRNGSFGGRGGGRGGPGRGGFRDDGPPAEIIGKFCSHLFTGFASE